MFVNGKLSSFGIEEMEKNVFDDDNQPDAIDEEKKIPKSQLLSEAKSWKKEMDAKLPSTPVVYGKSRPSV
jgi:hypothetical protein